jgi:MoxR-like ATPase
MYERISADELSKISATFIEVKEAVSQLIVGNDDLIDLMFIGLLSGGHVLIEGVPGTAKTTLVKAMAQLMGCEFNRVQCAVDTQPADVIGIRVWDQQTGQFSLRKGPLFTDILLIDEINRLPPKSQSAFIEAMSERQATIDGITVQIEAPFIVIATQNPFEQEGTFPLIEAQKDRFMFSFQSRYMGSDEELEIIKREHDGVLDWKPFLSRIETLLDRDDILEFIASVRKVHISEPVQEYIRDLVIATRTHSDVRLGVSSRGSIALVRGSRAWAALNSRDFVIPDDVKKATMLAFKHRMILQREAEISGISPAQIVGEILQTVEVP